MKKNIVSLFTILFVAIVFIISCDTKDDPPVPNHTTTITSSTSSTGGTTPSSYGTLTSFGTTFSLDSGICGTDAGWYEMAAKNSSSQTGIGLKFLGTPTASGTYNTVVDDPTSSGEVQLSLVKDGSSLWECLTGTVSVTVNNGNISASFSNITFYGPTAADSTVTSCTIHCQ